MKLTPLYNIHTSMGAKMITTAAGYSMPAHYRSAEEEHHAVRERVGMSDHSLMGRIDVKGKDSLAFLQRLAVNDASKLKDGQLIYTTLCNEQGQIMDDLTIWRFNDEHFRVVTSSVMRNKTYQWLIDHKQDNADVYLTDISSGLGMISVQGPKSRETLQQISDVNLNDVKFFHFAQVKLKGTVPGILAHVGFTGELGFECYFSSEDTVQAWKLIQDAGSEFGLLPYGFDALDSLRYEKGYIFYGYEVTAKNNPFECGLERWIAFDKANFLGKAALSKIRERGVERKLMGLEVEDGGSLPVAEKQVVSARGKPVGETVVGFRALTLGKNIAWAWLDDQSSELGTTIEIDDKSKIRTAKVVSLRLYDPSGKRMRV